jgi:hypothetical protein
MDPGPDSYRDSREICRNRFGSRSNVDNGAAKIGVCAEMKGRYEKRNFGWFGDAVRYSLRPLRFFASSAS